MPIYFAMRVNEKTARRENAPKEAKNPVKVTLFRNRKLHCAFMSLAKKSENISYRTAYLKFTTPPKQGSINNFTGGSMTNRS